MSNVFPQPDWQSPDGEIRLYRGDCLDLLPQLPEGCVDACVTDPPYMVGAVSVGNAKSKSGTWADMENAAWWFARWYEEARRVTGQAGYLATFGNWRSIPTMICALAKCQWAATSCIVWDKEWIGPAYKNALRPTHEIILLAAKPDSMIANRSEPDVWRCKWLAGQSKTTDHPAEKPVALVERLVRNVSQPRGSSHEPCNGWVIDPFLGSGTTGVACIKTGRQFIGVEKDPHYFDVAVHRIEQALADQALFTQAEAATA